MMKYPGNINFTAYTQQSMRVPATPTLCYPGNSCSRPRPNLPPSISPTNTPTTRWRPPSSKRTCTCTCSAWCCLVPREPVPVHVQHVPREPAPSEGTQGASVSPSETRGNPSPQCHPVPTVPREPTPQCPPKPPPPWRPKESLRTPGPRTPACPRKEPT